MNPFKLDDVPDETKEMPEVKYDSYGPIPNYA